MNGIQLLALPGQTVLLFSLSVPHSLHLCHGHILAPLLDIGEELLNLLH